MHKKILKITILLLLVSTVFILSSCGLIKADKPPINDEIRVVLYSDDSSEPITLRGKAGETLSLPTLEKKGYEFDGWYCGENLFTQDTFPSKSIALRASFTELEYTLAFNTMGASPIETETLTYFQYFSLPTPYRDGYTFGGWFYDADYQVLLDDSYLNMPDNSLTLYAKWLREFTISFVTDCDYITYDIQTYPGNTIFAPNLPRNKGYYFFGWYDNQEFAGQPYEFNLMPDQDIILYAKWGIKQISNKEEFSLLSIQPYGGYKLTNDIDMRSQPWQPIAEFYGMFDGNNKKIENLLLNLDQDRVGLFATNNGVIKNLELLNYTIDTETDTDTEDNFSFNHLYVGSLVANNRDGKLENCIASGTINIVTNHNVNQYYVGGLVGYASKTQLNECSFCGEIKFENYTSLNIGGLLGGAVASISLSNCSTSGLIKNMDRYYQFIPNENIGGMIGTLHQVANSNIDLAQSDMNIELTRTQSSNNIGGLIGKSAGHYNSNIMQSTFNGEITINQGDFDCGTSKVGGIVGYNENIGINKCYTDADILVSISKDKIYLGGIVGHNKDSSIRHAYSLSNITVQKAQGLLFGGIAGYNEDTDNSHTISQCYNEGQLQINSTHSYGGADYFGGIVGLSNGQIKECYSCTDLIAGIMGESKIEGIALYVGGIAGKIDTDKDTMSNYNLSNIYINALGDIFAGGIVGAAITNQSCFIAECYSQGDIEIINSQENYESFIGGIVGYAEMSVYPAFPIIHSCYSSSDINVSGNDILIGGIVGECTWGKVYNSFFIGNIHLDGSSNSIAGGIFGKELNCEKVDSFRAEECQIIGASQTTPSSQKPKSELISEAFLTDNYWDISKWSFEGLPTLVDDRSPLIWNFNILTKKNNPTLLFSYA